MQKEQTLTRSAIVKARMRPGLKQRAERVFRHLGLSTDQAIALFYRQVELHNGLPFDLHIPNETTRKTFADTDAGRGLTVCDDIEDMFEKLGI